MERAFFPLDTELDLPPTCLLPHAHQAMVRLGALLPFAQAAKQLEALLGIQVSPSLVRQQTEHAGRGSLAVQTAQASRWPAARRSLPPSAWS